LTVAVAVVVAGDTEAAECVVEVEPDVVVEGISRFVVVVEW
jgi:autonomous glycyl radical cofactor GrcA